MAHARKSMQSILLLYYNKHINIWSARQAVLLTDNKILYMQYSAVADAAAPANKVARLNIYSVI